MPSAMILLHARPSSLRNRGPSPGRACRDSRRPLSAARLPDAHGDDGNPWVFGYGSLIWNPGLRLSSAREKALLRGAHRSLSIYSHRHRGTPEQPGLVFGLSRGGSCLGVAFEVDGGELARGVRLSAGARAGSRRLSRGLARGRRSPTGERVQALAYLVNENHPQFAGRLDLGEQVRLVAAAAANPGSNTEYVRNTAQHLMALGIRDRAADGASSPRSTATRRCWSEAPEPAQAALSPLTGSAPSRSHTMVIRLDLVAAGLDRETPGRPHRARGGSASGSVGVVDDVMRPSRPTSARCRAPAGRGPSPSSAKLSRRSGVSA